MFFPQAVYAAVHDAALVVGTAVQNLFNSGEEIMTIDSRLHNHDCPLQSTSTRRGGLGWKLLWQIRKVKMVINYV